MDLAKQFGTDKAVEAEGAWIDAGGGARLKVARMGNPAFKREFRERTASHKLAMKSRTMDDADAERILCAVMARTILLGWEGLQIAGEALKYSVANAETVLLEYPDFRDLVTAEAGDIQHFLAGEVESAKGNSPKSSAGS